MFQPPRCPFRHCPNHERAPRDFYVRKGSYTALCRPQPIPRFRCRACGRTFSRQTFRMDYRDHRPYLNSKLFELITSGVGLRQSARILGLSLSSTQLKFRKIARHLRRLNLNLRGELPDFAELQFDELETYEGRRNTRPLTIPILIERGSRFVIWSESATIRAHGKMSTVRKKALQEDETRFGRRVDRSRNAIRRTLQRGASIVRTDRCVLLTTDEKSSYPGLARCAFGERLAGHRRVNSKLARMTWNPLFPINHTEATARDLLGRLRRESWLVSKKRRFLDLGLQVWMAYRNYVRRRFNYDQASPAELLGFARRRMGFGELLTWRQDWGSRSIHPMSRSGTMQAA